MFVRETGYSRRYPTAKRVADYIGRDGGRLRGRLEGRERDCTPREVHERRWATRRGEGWTAHHLVVSPSELERPGSLVGLARATVQPLADEYPELEWVAAEHRDTDMPHAHILAWGAGLRVERAHLGAMKEAARGHAERMLYIGAEAERVRERGGLALGRAGDEYRPRR